MNIANYTKLHYTINSDFIFGISVPCGPGIQIQATVAGEI